MSRVLFVNLPVNDLPASREFFETLGFGFDRRFCEGGAACLIVSEHAYVMLLRRDCFADFVTRPVADAFEATALTVAISAEDRAAVDRFADQALEAGATPAKPPLELGFMYQRTFHDLDGHLWEVVWMDPFGPQSDIRK